jgi:hypothetical protein
MNEGHSGEWSFLHCSRAHFAFVVESFIEILIVVQMPNIFPGAMNCTKGPEYLFPAISNVIGTFCMVMSIRRFAGEFHKQKDD